MRCAGCVGRVKSLLEAQPAVQGASVNLATETAMARVTVPAAEAARAPLPAAAAAAAGPAGDLEAGRGGGAGAAAAHSVRLAALGATLARVLTDAGFATAVRDPDAGSGAAGRVLAAKREERLARLADATRRLAVAWLLASGCLLHHAVHWAGARAPMWLHALASTPVHAALSALAILGAWAWLRCLGGKLL